MALMQFNVVVTILLISDLLIVIGFGFIEPILAVFITDSIPGATLATAGIASGIFLVTKSLVQIPFSRRVDRHGEKYAVRWLFVGTLLVATTPLIYLSANTVAMIYLAQIINGLGSGMAFPSWLGLWSKHLDKGKESFEWSFYSTVTGLAAAAAAPMGAFIAYEFGFQTLFLSMFFLAITGAFSILLFFRKSMLFKGKSGR